MSSNDSRPVALAAPGTRCGWTFVGDGVKMTCQVGDGYAVHVLTETLPVGPAGTALCAYHSPFDATAEERMAVVPFETQVAIAPVGEIIDFQAERDEIIADADRVWSDKSRTPKWGDAVKVGGAWSASGRIVAVEAEQTGVEVLAEMLTLTPAEAAFDAEVTAVQTARFHKLSAPMIGVIAEVSRMRGLSGAWVMRNVIIREVPGASMRTVAALSARGILGPQSNDGDVSGTGGQTDYVLTDRGADVAERLGYPVPVLPTDRAGAEAMVAGLTRDACETGCEALIARGVILLPAGGDVCLGCGAIFTRPNGQLHPGLDMVSRAVVARNLTQPDYSDLAEAAAQRWAEAGHPRDAQGRPVVPGVAPVITDADMRRFILAYIDASGESADDYAVDLIIDAVQAELGTVDLGVLPAGRFAEFMAAGHMGQSGPSVEQMRAAHDKAMGEWAAPLVKILTADDTKGL